MHAQIAVDHAIPVRRSQALSAVAGMTTYIADLTCGPTGSWKDFLAGGVVREARQQGKSRLVVASSGNHGMAIAVAGREAGMSVCVLTYPGTAAAVKERLTAAGAEVVVCESRKRLYSALDNRIAAGWFSATLTNAEREAGTRRSPGSAGFSPVAEAIAATVGGKPLIVTPTCYGDGAAAIADAFTLRFRVSPMFCLVRANETDGDAAFSISTDVESSQVRGLLSAGAVSCTLRDADFLSGLPVMENELGVLLDVAEGGIPAALKYLAQRGTDATVAVCLITGRR